MKKRAIVFAAISLLFYSTYASKIADVQPDSLFAQIAVAQITEHKRAEAYRNFALNHSVSHPNLAIQAFENASEIFFELGDRGMAVSMYGPLAEICNNLGAYDQSMEYLFRAYKQHKETRTVNALAWLHVDMGNIYYYAANPEKARHFYELAYIQFDEANFHLGKSVVLLNYGLINEQLGYEDSALYYFELSKKERIKTGDPFLIAHIMHYIARNHYEAGETENARIILKRSDKMLHSIPIKVDLFTQSLFENKLLTAFTYYKDGNAEKALLETDSALAIAIYNTDTIKIIDALQYRADCNTYLNNPDEAAKCYRTILELTREDLFQDIRLLTLSKLSMYHVQKGENTEALRYMEEHLALHHSIEEQNTEKKSRALEAALDFELQNIEIEEIKKNEAYNRNKIIILILFLVLLLLIGSLIFFYKLRIWKSNQTLINTAFDGIIIHHKGKIVDVNKSFLTFSGFSASELKGKSILKLVQPIEKEQVIKNISENLKVFYNSSIQIKNGAVVAIEAEAQGIRYKGKNMRIITIKDVSERIKAENQIRLFGEKQKRIFDTIDALVFVVDSISGNIIISNQTAIGALGKLEGQDINQIFNTDAPLQLNTALVSEQSKTAEERQTIRFEAFVSSQNVWYELNMRHFEWVDGRLVLLIVAYDVTPNKNTIAELNELNATKDKFFSIIAHDLKNPFQGLLGLSEMLLTGFDLSRTDVLKQMIEQIHITSKNSYELLENLLEWAKLQKGITGIKHRKLDLYYYINQCIQSIRHISEAKHITITNSTPQNCIVSSDEHVLNTVLRNLLLNAVKFSHENSTIAVKVADTGNSITISVIDNGLGIPAEMIPLLFRIDTKYTVLGTAGERGNGLGLILCHELIEKNGGSIFAESTLGKGSTFSFTVQKVADSE